MGNDVFDDEFDFDDDGFGDDDEFDTDALFDDDDGDSWDNDDSGDWDDEDDQYTDADIDDDLDYIGDDDQQWDEVAGGGGPSRNFIMLAAAMVFIFVIGIVLVVFLALNSDDGPSNIELTATQITIENMTAEAQNTQVALETTRIFEAELTEEVTQQAIAAGETMTAKAVEAAANDAFATHTAVAMLTPVETAVPTLSELQAFQTQQAQTATAEAQAAAAAQTMTAAAEQPVEEPTVVEEVTSAPPDINAIQLTATAIKLELEGGALPTDAPGIGGATGIAPTESVNIGDQLPNTGLFDDVNGSSSSLALIGLIAFGLVGVIFGARGLRMANNKQKRK